MLGKFARPRSSSSVREKGFVGLRLLSVLSTSQERKGLHTSTIEAKWFAFQATLRTVRQRAPRTVAVFFWDADDSCVRQDSGEHTGP